jgi:hypothetical protein
MSWNALKFVQNKTTKQQKTRLAMPERGNGASPQPIIVFL